MDNSPGTYVERPLQAAAPVQHSEEKDTIDLLKLWRVVWRAKWNIGCCILLSSALAVAVVSTITPQYIGSTTLLIKDTTPPLLNFQQTTDKGGPTPDYLQTQLALLQSRELAERVVRKLKLTTHPVTDPRQQPQPWFKPRQWLADLNHGQWLPGLGFLTQAATTPTEEDDRHPLASDFLDH